MKLKHLTLSIILLGIVAKAQDQFVDIPDKRLKRILVKNKKINENNDDKISFTEAENYVGKLNIENKKIKSLKGLEYFINLTGLNCSGNLITEINLGRLNNLGNRLKELDCSNNQLRKLDIKRNYNLISLNCSGNQLKELDVSGNTQLKTLNCSKNKLSSLDLSKIKGILNLDCSDNQISELKFAQILNNEIQRLNISNNTNLKCVQLKETSETINSKWKYDSGLSFNCEEYENRGFIKFKDENFKQYLIANPEINTDNDAGISFEEAEQFTGKIDCSGLEISDLSDIEMFKNLTELDCSDNDLNSLNIQNNKTLTKLNCSSNNISELNVSSNKLLEIVNCSNNQLSNINVKNNLNLLILDVSNNQLSDINVSKNTKLLKLFCFENQIAKIDIKDNVVLQELWASDNQLTELDVRNNPDLVILRFYYNKLSEIDVSQNPKIENLFFSGNRLTNLDLSSNVALKHLNGALNQLESLNLANGNNSNLESVNLSGNANLDCVKVDSNFKAPATSEEENTGWNYYKRVRFKESCIESPAIINVGTGEAPF